MPRPIERVGQLDVRLRKLEEWKKQTSKVLDEQEAALVLTRSRLRMSVKVNAVASIMLAAAIAMAFWA